MKITIDIPDEEVEPFLRFLVYTKMCGSLFYDIDLIQRVAIRVAVEIERLKKEESDAAISNLES